MAGWVLLCSGYGQLTEEELAGAADASGDTGRPSGARAHAREAARAPGREREAAQDRTERDADTAD